MLTVFAHKISLLSFLEILTRGLCAILGAMGIAMAIDIAPWTKSIENAKVMRSHLISREAIPDEDIRKIAFAEIPGCETEARMGVALAKLALADQSLGYGRLEEMDRRLASVDSDIDVILACAPTNGFAWLLKFWKAASDGNLDSRTTMFLDRSYRFAPCESWIMARRLRVAIPLYGRLPDDLKVLVIADFHALALAGLSFEAVAGYLSADTATRAVMRKDLENAPDDIVNSFDKALIDLGEAPIFDLALRRRFHEVIEMKWK